MSNIGNARDMRLRADYESLQRLCEVSNGALEIQEAIGKPPDQYVMVYNCRSISKLQDGKPSYSHLHLMRIRLPARYPLPSAPPRLEMLTPLYNPHIYPNQQVCLGAWQTTEYLDELVARVGALIQFDRRILNLRDPADPDAMEWVKKNFLLLPTDDKIFGAQDVASYSVDPKVLFGGDPAVAEVLNDNESDVEWIDN